MKLISAAVALSWSVCNILGAQAAFDLEYDDDSDLTNFVTHPEIRTPLFNVDAPQRDRVSPGYWFVAPYANLLQESFPSKFYQPCQTGPAIYDNNGDLVWTGSCMVRNRNTCDFKVTEYNDTYHLSSIIMPRNNDEKGFAVTWDSSYAVTNKVIAPKLIDHFNMHEFTVINDGQSALTIISRSEHIEIDDELDYDEETGWILNMGLRESDVKTGETIFEWWAYPEVRPTESKVEINDLDGPHPGGWNLFHFNSVDKNAEGDYMVSSRYTDTIFKISGKTGKLEWRLEGSGKTSDFLLNNFNFSRQHSARWIEHSKEREVISFLDNASDGYDETSDHSSVLVVELDKTSTPWNARVVQRWVRPDQSLSRLRGNAQLLENGNMWTCWSDNSYLTEHSADGELLMNATFRSKRFVTYRGYKFNFTGTPQEPPVLKGVLNGPSRDQSTTTLYVSWNGATEVASWNFYQDSQGSDDFLLGTKRRSGFETAFHTAGYSPRVYAEAVAADGSVLGRTPTFKVNPLDHWEDNDALPVDYSVSQMAILTKTDSILDLKNFAAGNSSVLESAGYSVYSDSYKQHVQLKNLGVGKAIKSEL